MNRKLGCISSAENERLALKYGFKSDRDSIVELAAPWDKTDKPSIITWNKDWKDKLEKEANALDKLRDAGTFPSIWGIALKCGYNLSALCDSIQRGNDCTAWGTSRAAVCLALYQMYLGAEIDVTKYNPTGVYAYSSNKQPSAWISFPDNGRTIYGIAEAACEIGNFPTDAIGGYTGDARFTQRMIDSVDVAEKNQMGFVYLGNESRTPEELADIVILSVRACRPCIIGNTVALQDGTALNQDGVYVSNVGGGWGGGHCTAAVDIKKVGNDYYIWIYNSHGKLYLAGDGSPDEGTYITRKGLIKYLSGSFADVMPTTYIERPRVEYTDYRREVNG